ncbi:alcohol acetyltransferase superfamily, partial [Listeria seeligeri FSL S4-171]
AETPHEAELADKYLEIVDLKPQKVAKEKSERIYQFCEKKEENLYVTTIKLTVSELKKRVNKLGVSLTVLITAFIAKAILTNQKEDKKQEDHLIKILLPIDLRNFFPSQTLRNFVLYAKPEINPKEVGLDIERIAFVIQKQLAEVLSEKQLRARVSQNIRLEQNPIIKHVPLFMKRYLMKFFSVSEKTTCLTLSNLGVIKMPEEMARYVDSFNFVLSPRSKTPYNIGISSFNGEMRINITRSAEKPLLERALITLLTAQELTFEVETN